MSTLGYTVTVATIGLDTTGGMTLDNQCLMIIIIAIVLMFLAMFFRSKAYFNMSIIFSIFDAVAWFAVAFLWLISSSFSTGGGIISIVFMGLGVIMVVFTISDSIEYMRQAVTQNEGDA